MPFGKFFWGTCDSVNPRRELNTPKKGDLPPVPSLDCLRSAWSKSGDGAAGDGTSDDGAWSPVDVEADVIMKLMGCNEEKAADTIASVGGEAAMKWVGGESSGLKRLAEYTRGALGTYHRTRNQLYGKDHSSHLSPWMASGCLSPRTVYWRAKENEDSHATNDKNQPVFKFWFELAWRDYFRFYIIHNGKEVFFKDGPAKRERPWHRDADMEDKWRHGMTGVPLVDALMRELNTTGFMSNRGRYVVASYLVHYLGIDWRVGADWFESLLLDHDVASNYGEWASMAMVAVAPTAKMPLGLKGRGPSTNKGFAGKAWEKNVEGDAAFDPWEQAKQYDRSEVFVRHWVPELQAAPKGYSHYQSNSVGFGTYPEPLTRKPFEIAGASASAWQDHRRRGTFEKPSESDAQDHARDEQPKQRRVYLRSAQDVTSEANRKSKSTYYGDGQQLPTKVARRWQAKSGYSGKLWGA
eukprot:gnl/MRDRNA2_/MRDRNA2_216731_c0_seq1.p1 gnl/MRDRNA2_/MRDRNA2_216731_c0~~gnl/MRDRNA2_/MRDRNA2_216731_c0_seq1.p1  ORF type:complete len:466 (-),score=85.93 gnl/MRDRNA2_/MRDRNA2_216731_c0_seq1:209-1606(-)